MNSALFPLKEKLSFDVMLERIETFGGVLRAIRAYRRPDPDKKMHLLVKDNMGLEGFTTTAGSWALRDLKLPDAFCVRKLKDAGMDVFGKTHLRELAGFVSTAHPTRAYSFLGGFGVNPHGDFACGGSSSGSAIAVAAGLCDAALGTETNGSLMSPGLRCGVWAVKPTRGLVSRTGIVPLSLTLDTPGVLARSVKDLQTVLAAMTGFDAQDAITEVAKTVDWSLCEENQPTYRIGFMLPETFEQDSEGRILFERFKAQAIAVGIECVEIGYDKVFFDYKTITSTDIRKNMDEFLARHAVGTTPRSYDELVAIYRENPNVRPYGMDRLEDAYRFSLNDENRYRDLVRRNLAKADRVIEETLSRNACDALATFETLDWWAISGAPSVAVPMALRENGAPFGFMMGMRQKEDVKLLTLSKRLEQNLSAFR